MFTRGPRAHPARPSWTPAVRVQRRSAGLGVCRSAAPAAARPHQARAAQRHGRESGASGRSDQDDRPVHTQLLDTAPVIGAETYLAVLADGTPYLAGSAATALAYLAGSFLKATGQSSQQTW